MRYMSLNSRRRRGKNHAEQRLTSTSIEQICAGRGALHTIPMKQASIKARKGPYGLSPGDTLALELDGKPAPNNHDVRSARERRRRKGDDDSSCHGRGGTARDGEDADNDALRINSCSADLGTSSIRVTRGTARD